MMESTLVADGGGSAAAAPPTGGGGDPLFSADDDGAGGGDLFGSVPPTSSSASGHGFNGGLGSSREDLMGQLLGGKPSAGSGAGGGDAVPQADAAVTSKLSASGLLGPSSSSGGGSGLFGDDDDVAAPGGGGGGGGGGDGLFAGVDAEEAERQRRAAAQTVQDHHDANVDVMHELNLDGDDGHGFMGMGMGLGGEIQPEHAAEVARPPAAAPPPAPGPGAPGGGGQPYYQQQQYRQLHPQQQPPRGVMNAMAGSYMYSTTGAGQTAAGPGVGGAPPSHHQQPSVLAGMHVGHDVNLGGVPGAPPGSQGPFTPVPGAIADYVPPDAAPPVHGKVVVDDPMLVQGSGLFAGPPHWTYLVTVHAISDPARPVSAVRRRFRHFVALEDRLRQGVPGAILPPRPDKHPARAIEEATARQSAEFAKQRAAELGTYLNALAEHPHAGPSAELRLFLALQDHIGTAWPEVSSSAFTRMTAVGSAAVERMGDAVDAALSELGTAQQVAAGEDCAEILALAAYEGRRIGAVTSSVPKVEGCVALVRERGDRMGATGLEAGKLARDVGWCDRDLAGPTEVLSAAMLRCGRRTRRLGLELGAAIAPFAIQYRTCRYERLAFADRRTALKRRTEARVKADGRATKLMMNSHGGMAPAGRLGTLERMETDAAVYDEMASEAAREADEVADRLRSEVGRIAAHRTKEWDASLRVVASGMREACAENAAIWEGALEAFRREFPDCPGLDAAVGGGVGANAGV
ncbi:hypothetical protein ACHAWF_004738 [Thalassiosira exigua]